MKLFKKIFIGLLNLILGGGLIALIALTTASYYRLSWMERLEDYFGNWIGDRLFRLYEQGIWYILAVGVVLSVLLVIQDKKNKA